MRLAHATGPCAGRPILSKTYPNPTICTKCAAIGLDMGPASATPVTYNVTYLMFDAN